MLLTVGLPLALAIIMFSLGLGLVPRDFLRVLTQPKAFATGLANQVFLLPIIGLGLVVAFDVRGELAVGVMLLAAAPGGVTSNVLSKLALGNVALSVSLTAIVSLLSIITVPLITLFAINRFLGAGAFDLDIASVSFTMFLITVVPVLLGMGARALLGSRGAAAERVLSMVSVALFAIVVIAALASNWTLFIDSLGQVGLVIIALITVMLALGLLSGRLMGLKGADATTIAIESGIQNGTLAIAVAGLIVANVSNGDTSALGPFAIPAAVYGVFMYLIGVPFALWRRRQAQW